MYDSLLSIKVRLLLVVIVVKRVSFVFVSLVAFMYTGIIIWPVAIFRCTPVMAKCSDYSDEFVRDRIALLITEQYTHQA